MIISELFRKWFKLEKPPCESCEILRTQLNIANFEKKQLLDNILEFTKPRAEEKIIVKEIDPRPRAVPFSVRRSMLEEEDRAKAEILKRKEPDMIPSNHPVDETMRQDIDDLEKELGIPNG